jgi:hypothetical protein
MSDEPEFLVINLVELKEKDRLQIRYKGKPVVELLCVPDEFSTVYELVLVKSEISTLVVSDEN